MHRAVYRQSGYGAVLHAHPPYTVALSFTRDKIEPIDSEAAYLFKQVPVITARQTIGSEEVADKLPAALQQAPVAVLRGHGSFAVGRSLEEAFQYTTALELAAKIIWLSNGYRP